MPVACDNNFFFNLVRIRFKKATTKFCFFTKLITNLSVNRKLSPCTRRVQLFRVQNHVAMNNGKLFA